MNASETQPSGLGMRMQRRRRREIKKEVEKVTPGLGGGKGAGSGRKFCDSAPLQLPEEGGQALLSRKAGGWVSTGRASFWAKRFRGM